MVRAFAEKVLFSMGRDKLLLANFASEAVKASTANVLINTTARRTEGGWLLNGEKSFGCLSGTADHYLVTVRREDVEGIDGLSLSLVARDSEGIRPRARWNGLGMRASDNHGLVIEDCFVADDDALTVPGAFTRATADVARLLGRQPGRDRRDLRRHRPRCVGVRVRPDDGGHVRRHRQADRVQPDAPGARRRRRGGASPRRTCGCAGRSTSRPATRRSSPSRRSWPSWKLAKGAICERSFSVAIDAAEDVRHVGALMDNVIGRAVRDTSMGLVQAFPAERGKLDLARMMVEQESGPD